MTTNTRDSVLAEIQAMSDVNPINVLDTSELRVQVQDGSLYLRTNARTSYEITEEGLAGLAYQTRAPASLIKHLTPKTAAAVLTETIQPRGAVTLLTNSGGELIDVVKPGQYHMVEPAQVFQAVEQAVPGFDVCNLLKLPNHTVRLEILGRDEPKPVPYGHDTSLNDMIKAGVLVEFSPLGVIDPKVQSFVQRLVCTNGMVSTDVVRSMTLGRGGAGEGDDLWQWFRHSAAEAYASIDRIVARYGDMVQQGIPAPDRAAVLAALLKEAGLGRETRDAVTAQAIENPPQNHYDMLNLVTWASTHVEQDPVRVRRAQNAAATYTSTDEHHRICPTCRN